MRRPHLAAAPTVASMATGGSQRERATAGDHGDGDGGQEVAAEHVGGERDDRDDRQVPGGEAIGQALGAPAVGLGFLHQPHRMAEGGVGPDALGADAQAAELGEGGGEDLHARLGLERCALAGDAGLVDAGVAGEDRAVDGDGFARPHDHDVATHTCLAGTVISWPSRSTRAVGGARAARSLTERRARVVVMRSA